MTDISVPALEKALAKAKECAPSAGGKVEIAKVDVSKEADIESAVAKLDAWGGVDIMFNNAGIMHADDAGESIIITFRATKVQNQKKTDMSPSFFLYRRRRHTRENLGFDTKHQRQRRMVSLDQKSTLTRHQKKERVTNPSKKTHRFGSKHAVLSLRKHHKTKGSIINTASVVALVGSATPQLAYTASKGAVAAMTRELAIVHAREGYRFNSLCPAPLNTPLLQDWLGDDQAKRHRREVHFPSGRFGEAVEQAQAVLFLASDEASFVNGHDMVVDGGMTKAYVTPEGPPTQPPVNAAR